MRILRLTPALALLAAACHNGGGNDMGPDMAGPTTRTLVLLHSNDEHSHQLGFGPESDDYPTPSSGAGVTSGVGRRLTLLKQQRMAAMTAGADTLTVSAGDNAMGTLSEIAFTGAAPDLTGLATLGYDVDTIGNHEFDYGPDGLAKAIGAAKAANMGTPTVASNLHFSGTAGDASLQALYDDNLASTSIDMSKPIHRWFMKTTPSGLKVGFIGILGTDAAKSAPDKTPVVASLGATKTEGFTPENLAVLYSDLQPVVDHLRNDVKVDLVIALSHSGVDSTTPANSEDELIAQNVAGIDVICSGHTHIVFKAKQVTGKNGKPTLVQQAGQFGQFLGKVTIKVDPTGAVSFDMSGSDVLPVDDSLAWDSSLSLDGLVKSVEATSGTGGKTFLENTLNRIITGGTPIVDDPNKTGDTFFYPIGKTGFDVDGLSKHKEVPGLALHADALLYAANQLAGHTDLTITAGGEGVVRANISKGKTGTISFADVYRILPLGRSPLDNSIGFPLARAGVWVAVVRAAFELTAGVSYHSDNESDQFIAGAGVKVFYDTSLPALDFSSTANLLDASKGRVTKILLATTLPAAGIEPMYNVTLFDKSAAMPWYGGTDPTKLVIVATSYHLIEFAGSIGATLYDPNNLANALTDPKQSVVLVGGAEVKDWEVLASYIHGFATLPPLYDASKTDYSTMRLICAGPLCVK